MRNLHREMSYTLHMIKIVGGVTLLVELPGLALAQVNAIYLQSLIHKL